MQLPLQITFRHMAPSLGLEGCIRQRAEEFERFYDRITSCRVVVERAHHRHQQGNLFEVKIDLTVPGNELVTAREHRANHAHEDPYVAVRDAFDAARRLLEDHARRRRGEAKTHLVPDHGRIARLLPERDCGFIETAAGEVYFHRNSVANDGFDRLEVGVEVRFVAQEAESPEGPQASTVVPLGKHHLPPTETVRGA